MTTVLSHAEGAEVEARILADPQLRCELADARMQGLAETLALAFSEVRHALKGEECENVTQDDVDRFEVWIRSVLRALLRTGTGDAAKLTDLALELEPLGIAFAAKLHRLADLSEMWRLRRYPEETGSTPEAAHV